MPGGSGIPSSLIFLVAVAIAAIVAFYAFTFRVDPDELPAPTRRPRWHKWITLQPSDKRFACMISRIANYSTGNEKVVAIVRWRLEGGVASTTITVKEELPVPVGVPDSTPAGDNVSPAGGVLTADHVYGAVPPLAVRVWL